MRPSKARGFLWLVADRVSERPEAQGRFGTPLLALKTEGAT